ncbi:TPA: toprim domain-containing protein [Streptococcus agalactiae]|uniref:PBECR4 domain-containing protein n=1 Tax=Streptococcus anginosus TaxID=1328 RepID=UPI000C79CEC3|nr:PBECR4 domain-containing protein [Streptococcus anginosus]HEO1095020.1 toprim domain-containing protein [Streptococcus agalactiae]HEP5504645.1 toprim domain-containing protein [Streptococcus pyogenes]MED5842295.1 PBECR4 domain-containing protein [Streptococcus anginosus]MED5869112.1 PBECR4 domain-containing protein [Streptococcus anginosus]MED5898872.1 PBECR4 domain-containing protein [Streptococcus anginosus]
MTEQESRRGKSRRERVEFARSRDILDVANELQMELVRSGRDYRWKEHDSLVISPDKNLWKWFSRNTGGDAISLVETIKEVDFNQSVDFLNDGNFKEFQMVARAQEDFKYYLEKYEQQFSAGRDYLRNQRGLSDETIDYFLKQGVLAQANAKLDYFAEGDSGVTTNAIEPVIVFKSLSSSGEVVGASLQGIQENWEKWPKHGYAKVIMKNSDPMTGIHVDIGSPKRLIFTESPIDLMSYYELHKDSLQDVRLVSMDGLKESTIGRHLSQIQAEISGKPLRWTPEQMADGLQVAIDHHFFEDGKNADLITLALDNDKAGRTFIQELEAKGAVINSDLPELRPGQDKTDWNDVLKNQQEEKSDSRESEFEEKAEATLSESSPFPDTSHLSPEDATWLKENWNNISFSVQSTRSSETDLTMEDKHIPSNQESIANTEKNAERLMSYEEVKQENEALTKRLNNRIQSGELSIEFAPDFYLYDVFAKLGNSHPTKYLNDKRMEVLSPIHSLLSSIDDRTVDLYKKKGTPEQDSLYQALKPHQRALGVDISTQFIGELAIAAYNTNKQLESLSSDSFGAYFGERTLDNLSQSVERMLEYPLIESGTRDFAHGFVTTPNTLFHYLDEQEGEVVLNHELLDNLMSRLETHPIKIMETSEEKAPEKSQELDVILEQQKNERTSGSLGSLQPEAEGSPTPVPKVGTFERSVTSRPTTSSHLLYFTINEEFQSSNDGYYHSISLDELTKLNRPIRRLALQNAAQYYLDELANSKIYYVTPDKTVQVHFEENHFMHLTGIKPIASGQTPEKTLHDFAEGNGHFDNILLANNDAAFDKLKVLSDLSVATESTSFYFDDLTNLRRYDGRFDSLIKSDDKDIILLFKELEEENYIPISVFKSRTKLTKELETVDKTPILGVFRERDGQIEQLSINEEYVKDGGEEMLSILKNKQYEEVSEEPEPPALENTLNNSLLDANKFTQVLDTVYNLGVPSDISKTPEEFHQAWNQYLDYAKQYNDKFDQIVAAAGEDNLLDKNSDFYRDWHQDHIYKDDYHIRLQWSEDRPGGPKLPFKETELISYQDFARELYKANQDFYPIHQEGMKQVTAGNTEGYIPPTKIKFDVYAPGGEMIKEGIRYDIGAETTPISQMLGLGYRRLNGQSVLASMDEEILSQLENREVNKEISQEANESTRLTEEVAGQTPDTRETVAFKSSKQETKTNLLQRVEEILKEEPISDLETHEVNSSSIDYATLTPHELSEVAFKKVREYTETPERLEEYLNFMSKFPELSPRNVALIQEQWPGANAVATYNQWQSMGEVLGITSVQVFETRNTYTNKKTGRTREVVHNNLSVKTGEKSHITLFRPMMVEMIPVLDENGNQVKNGKGNPKYKRLSEATPEEKALKKEGKLKSRFFQERDSNTGLAKFATYKVFELSQTTLKPEFYPKAMPNRHYDFNMDHIRTKEVLEGLSDYAKNIEVTIYQDDAKELRSAKGAFYPDEQKILLNPDNTPGEVIATTIHELAHASLHNPKFANSYKEDVSKDRRELEAEMTSYLVSKHFGLDTSEKAIRYMAIWTDNLTSLDDQQLAQSMKRIHGTVSKIVKSVEQHTKPYQLNRQVVQNQNFIQSPKKGLKV